MIRNLAWDFIGKLGGQIVSFIISLLLARILMPEEFGIMGMAMSVITIANVLIGLGFTRAIIQRPVIDNIQYNTVFLINTGIALILTLICFFMAAPLSRFYQLPLIKPVFQVLSLTFLFNGLNIIPTALIYKRMNFRMATIFTLIASITSGTIGVIMAYSGYGVWALVTQAVLSAFINLLLNWFFIGWWPGVTVNFPSVRPLWQYGSRMFASGMLDVIFTRIDAFIIGKLFLPSTLGHYTRAQSLDTLVKQFSSNSITTVLFPYISANQSDRNNLVVIYKKYLHIISFMSIGLSAVFFLIAKDLFTFLFTARWEYAAELFQLMAISGFAWPVSALMVSVIAGMGNSRAYLRLELLKKAVLLPVYLFGFFIGLKGFILGVVVAYVISVFLNAKYVGKEIHLKSQEQLLVVAKYLLLGVSCVTGIWFLIPFLSTFTPIVRLLIVSFTFGSIYLAATYLLRLEAIHSINKMLQKTLRFIHDKRN